MIWKIKIFRVWSPIYTRERLSKLLHLSIHPLILYVIRNPKMAGTGNDRNCLNEERQFMLAVRYLEKRNTTMAKMMVVHTEV